MIPIDGLIQMALSFYEISLAVRHMGYTTTSGVDSRSVISTGTITAAVDPSRSKTMERIFGGSLSNGDIGVFTSDTLYIEDAAAAGASAANRMQSFVTYQGMTYRAVEVGDWTEQAGVRVYLCRKHLAQDAI